LPAVPETLEALRTRARAIRRDIVRMTTEAGSGHPSSSLSATEVVTALFFGGFLRHDPKNPHWPDRDRFILSKGHAAPVLYAALAEAGYFSHDQIMTLRKLGSPLEGHPNMRRLAGVEASTGSLGQGLSLGVGHALAARIDQKDYHTYVLTGDGELGEGQVWEAAAAAGKFKLDNLTVIVDRNRLQQGDWTEQTMHLEPLADKWRAFGWSVGELDGHNIGQMLDTFDQIPLAAGKPTCIIAHTHKGQGVSLMRDRAAWHHKIPNTDELAQALKELEEVAV
jgi:transketolase